MKYDVFISYKRDGGSAWAELLRAILEHKYHLKAFLDVKNMKVGEWSAQLDEDIRNSGNVIMILFKGIGKKNDENENYIINIDRDFTGRILVSFYGKEIPRVEHYIFVGKEIEKETSQTICFYREYTCWSPNNNEKETLEINTSVDWIDIKSRETAKDRYMAPTFDPMQTIEAAFQNLKMQDL